MSEFGALVATLGDVADEKCCGSRACNRHRCKALRANGNRCSRKIGPGMEDYCSSHGCVAQISFSPLPVMLCSAPVVYVNTGGDDLSVMCLAHAAKEYPGARILQPNFTYA